MSSVQTGIISLAVLITGGLIAYLMGKGQALQQASDNRNTDALRSIATTLTTHGEKLAELGGVMSPVVQEVELLAQSLGKIAGEVAVLQEWRRGHEKWSGDSIRQLNQQMSARRSTDQL